MGAREVYVFLEKHKGKWFATKDLAEKLDTHPVLLRRAAKKLEIYPEIIDKNIKLEKGGRTYLYKFK